MRKLLASQHRPRARCSPVPPSRPQDIKQGGSMIVTYKDDVITLDPAIGYDWQNWSMIKSLFDGLMDYEPGTTELVPDLAESYEISEDGLTYTFKLQEGVNFHNGRELTAEDVKYSIERVVRPETQSPGAGFFGMIAGFDEVQAGDAESFRASRWSTIDTVRFTLSRPDATFLHVMAINFAHAVPEEAVAEHGARLRQEPGRHRRLQAGRMDAGPAPRLRAERELPSRGLPEARPDHLRGRPGADRWRSFACRTARSTSWATASRRPSSSRSGTARSGATT